MDARCMSCGKEFELGPPKPGVRYPCPKCCKPLNRYPPSPPADCDHRWVGCTCSVCQSIRPKQHDWSQGSEPCKRCGLPHPGEEWLYSAATADDAGAVLELLDLGVAVDERKFPDRGDTLLIMAAGSYPSKLPIIQTLLSHGANLDMTGLWGRTALMAAAEKGHLDVVKVLLSAGANPKLMDEKGMTAADIAIERRKQKAWEKLQSWESRNLVEADRKALENINYGLTLASDDELTRELINPGTSFRSTLYMAINRPRVERLTGVSNKWEVEAYKILFSLVNARDLKPGDNIYIESKGLRVLVQVISRDYENLVHLAERLNRDQLFEQVRDRNDAWVALGGSTNAHITVDMSGSFVLTSSASWGFLKQAFEKIDTISSIREKLLNRNKELPATPDTVEFAYGCPMCRTPRVVRVSGFNDFCHEVDHACCGVRWSVVFGPPFYWREWERRDRSGPYREYRVSSCPKCHTSLSYYAYSSPRKSTEYCRQCGYIDEIVTEEY